MSRRERTPTTNSFRGGPRARAAHRVLWRGLISIIFVLAAVEARPEGATDLGRERGRLENIARKIEETEARRDKLQATADRLEGETHRLQKQLVVSATRIQAKEAEVASLEKDLKGLREIEEHKVALLERRSAELTNSLAALQRLSRQPRLAFLTRPEPAIDAVRSASLLGTVVPGLRSEAIDLGEEIAALNQLRDEISGNRKRLADALSQLDIDRTALDRMVREKQSQHDRFSEHAKAQAARAKRLAAQAKSVQDLISRLDAAQRVLGTTPRPRPRRKGARIDPAHFGGLPFSSARGTLALPARGRVARRFGQPDSTGSPLRGIYIETLGQARVTAPYDGQIVYAGPFRGYGQLLIIAHGEGYHTLLAGMSQIDGIVGQWVLSGEPIGRMGPDDTTDRTIKRPKLYVELRRHGEPINPLPWLAANKRKVRG